MFDIFGNKKLVNIAAEDMTIRADGVDYTPKKVGMKTDYPTLTVGHRKPLTIEVQDVDGERKIDDNSIYADRMNLVISSESESIENTIKGIENTGTRVDVLENEKKLIEIDKAEERRRRDPEFVEFCGVQIPQATVVEINFTKGVISSKKIAYPIKATVYQKN